MKILMMAFVLASISATLFLFQNCGNGFQGAESLASVEGADLPNGTGNPPPVLPPAAVTPAIVPAAGVNVLGMNIAAKILVNVIDSDSTQAQITYVVRSAPLRGQLTLDGPAVVANRGVTYAPATNFIGTDSFVLAARDNLGNMSADQRFDVRVDAKGIGQLIGSWSRVTCVPVTAPSTATYLGTSTSASYKERIFSQDCQTPILEVTISGSHSMGLEGVATVGGTTGFEYNFLNKTIFIRPLNAAGAQAMNQQAYCGVTNWVANVDRNITAAGCNGVWAGPNMFVYFRVEHPLNQPPRLFVASQAGPGDGTTAATRTQSLALNSFLTRDP